MTSQHPQQTSDLIFGFKKEKDVLPYFNKKFGCSAVLQKDKWATFDYYDKDNKVYGELKSRRVRKKQYDTIMIGYNKIRKGLKLIEEGYKVYLLWCFTDKLCYYELTAEFNKEWVSFNHLGRYDRGRNERQDLAFIPVDKLKNIVRLKR